MLEGLEQRVDVLAGEVPERVTVTETGVEYDVDLRRGQKTGLFLDQRENRAAAARYARGRMLDCFSYNGGFALVMGRRCDETIAFDVSEDAVARVRQNAARNGVAVDARVGNVFDELRGPRSPRRAVRHDRARPAGVRQEQGGGRQRARRLQGDQPPRAEAAESRRHARDLQLFLQHQRGRVRRDRLRRRGRRAGARDGGGEADAGARSSGAARRARDLLPEMLHPAESWPRREGGAGARARGGQRALARLARPSGDFDASRYFRGPDDLGFYNVGTAAMRDARAIDSRRAQRESGRSTTPWRSPAR